MAIKITENGVVNYENSPDVNRKLFPNLNICGKEINELADEIDGKAPLIVNTASGPIASFDNGADDMPLKSCIVSFGPIQEGSGDPSPENVRPISGRNGLSVVRTGKNLISPSLTSTTAYGITYTVNSDKSITVNGSATNLSPFPLYPDMRKPNLKAGATYYFGYIADPIIPPVQMQMYVDEAFLAQSLDGRTTTVTIPDNATSAYVRLRIGSGVTVENVTIYPMVTTAPYTEYIPPIDTAEVSVNWETEAGTVYGGSLDVVSGKLTVDSAYIASYNDESLPSTWISDRDVYAAGTTPTTGAQVVYKLAEPVEYQLTPQEIRTLPGVSNIWSDAGDVSVESPADTKTYIDELSIKTVEVSGQSPVITAEVNTRYICGEVTSLAFTPCETGICDVRFTAASISTVLTLPETVKLPDWFDPTLLEANTTYEINIVDGIYGVVMSWA